MIGPIVENPEIEYLYSILYIVMGAMVYIIFVYYKLKLKIIGKIQT